MENKGCSERSECANKFICKDSCPYKDRIEQSLIPVELLLLMNFEGEKKRRWKIHIRR